MVTTASLASSNSPDLDVLVVGAGPVGLTAAIELRRRNLSVRVIDAKDAPATTSRALGTHARTLEVYGHLGILDAVLAKAQPLNCFTVYTHGRHITSFRYDFSDLHPLISHSAFIGQSATEGILRERLAELGVAVEWGTSLAHFHDTGTVVEARLAHNEREELVRAAWMIGADGGHSFVRKSLKLPFEGASDETWLVADACIVTDLPRTSIHMVRHRDGNLLMFPFPELGIWRILETNPPPDSRQTDEKALQSSFTRRLSEGSGYDVQVEDLTWVSRFTIQQRQTPRLRINRVFLAGDAAHVHSPASGQGMNTGIQDAFNLCWKLALVHRGQAQDKLLDTYNTERRPVSADLLKSAMIATRLIQSRSGILFHLFTAALSLQDRIRGLHQQIERKITVQLSALSVHYEGDAPNAGERFPQLPSALWKTELGQRLLDWLRGTDVKLLFAGQPDPSLNAAIDAAGAALFLLDPNDADGAKIMSELSVGIDETVAWLLRPDGYLIARLDNPTDVNVRNAMRMSCLMIM